MGFVIHFVVLLMGAFSIYGQYYPPLYGFVPFPTYSQGIPWNNNLSNPSLITKNATCVQPKPDIIGSHSLFLGCQWKNDTLLYSEIINKPARYFSSRQKLIVYPDVGSMYRTRNISAIRCYDLIGNNRGGYATIMRGGVNQRFLKLQLTSIERNRPLQYKVEIYGRL